MKVTIAQLQEKIKDLQVEKSTLYEKYRELKDADEKRNFSKIAQIEEEKRQTDKQVSSLIEIIRWQVNPKTAEAPFMPMKNERDDNRRNH